MEGRRRPDVTRREVWDVPCSRHGCPLPERPTTVTSTWQVIAVITKNE